MYDGCMSGGSMGTSFGWLFPLLFFVAFFLVVWWVIKNNTGKSEIKESQPIDILKKRLAKGEITKKQFEDLKKEIE
jgi:putative membrane protein